MSDYADLVARLRASCDDGTYGEAADAIKALVRERDAARDAFTAEQEAHERTRTELETALAAIECPKDYVCISRRVDKARLAALARADALLRECDDYLTGKVTHNRPVIEAGLRAALAAFLRDREGGAPPVECRCGTCADWNEGDSFVRLHDSRYVARCDCERSEDYENMHSAQHGCPQWSAKKGGGA